MLRTDFGSGPWTSTMTHGRLAMVAEERNRFATCALYMETCVLGIITINMLLMSKNKPSCTIAPTKASVA